MIKITEEQVTYSIIPSKEIIKKIHDKETGNLEFYYLITKNIKGIKEFDYDLMFVRFAFITFQKEYATEENINKIKELIMEYIK